MTRFLAPMVFGLIATLACRSVPTFRAEMTSLDGDQIADAPLMVQRLAKLDIHAEVSRLGEHRILLNVKGDRAPGLIKAVGQRRLLAFHIVAEDQGPLRPGEVREPDLRIGSAFGRSSIYVAGTCAELEGLRKRLPRGDAAACECRQSGGADQPVEECSLWRLVTPAALTNEHVIDAKVRVDPRTGAPLIALDFSSEGARRLEDVTAANVRRKLAILLDGRIQSAPLIQERISGGRAVITLGISSRSPEESLREAEVLAAALATGSALSAEWNVVEVKPLQ